MGKTKVIRKKTSYGRNFNKALDAMTSSSGKDLIGVGWYGDQMHDLDGTPLPEIAYRNEYGGIASTEGPNGERYVIPPRPFMAPAINKNKKKWLKIINSELKLSFRKGKGNIDDVFIKVGTKVKSDIQNSIKSGGKKRLSDYTLKLRRERGNPSDIPLIDTSQLINSIEVRKLK